MSKVRLLIIICATAAISVGFFSFREYRVHKLSYLVSSYGSNLENRRFSAAEADARAMISLSKDAGVESLAHVGVIKFVQGGGDGIFREVELLEKGRNAADLPSAPGMLITMASVAAMTEKKAEALVFLNQFCDVSGIGDANVITCLHKTVEDDHSPGGIMINAVELYEAAYLEDFLFRRGHDCYYMLISAEYFDPAGAVARFKSDANGGFLNRDDIDAYCRNSVLKEARKECGDFWVTTEAKRKTGVQ